VKFVLLAAALAGGAAAEALLPARLCDMVEQPARFAGKLVSVRVETVVGFETQMLVDAACPGSRIWFEADQPKHDEAWATLVHAWKNNPYNLRRKVTATLIGRFETGDCFGHGCFSRSQLRLRQALHVTAIERRKAVDFTAYDCDLLRRDAQVSFRRGHIDNVLEAPVFIGSPEVLLVDPTGGDLAERGRATFQIALTRTKLLAVEARRGRWRLPRLAPGAYVFSATADGFQSVSGCIVAGRPSRARKPLRIVLPFGV
jgi:hypothetical protein